MILTSRQRSWRVSSSSSQRESCTANKMIFYGPAKSLLSLFLPFVEDFTVDKMIIDTKTRPPFLPHQHQTQVRIRRENEPVIICSCSTLFLCVHDRVCKLIMAVMTENASFLFAFRPVSWQPFLYNLEIVEQKSRFQERIKSNMQKLVVI